MLLERRLSYHTVLWHSLGDNMLGTVEGRMLVMRYH